MRGLTQERLSELSGVSRNQISNIERNISNTGNHVNPRLETIYQLARALEVPVAALLPASGELLQPILTGENVLNVDVVWPAQPRDLVAFDHRHLSEALPQIQKPEESSAVTETPLTASDSEASSKHQEELRCEEDGSESEESSGAAQPVTNPILAFQPPSEDSWLMGVEWPWAPRDSSRPAAL